MLHAGLREASLAFPESVSSVHVARGKLGRRAGGIDRLLQRLDCLVKVMVAAADIPEGLDARLIGDAMGIGNPRIFGHEVLGEGLEAGRNSHGPVKLCSYSIAFGLNTLFQGHGRGNAGDSIK
ncbi:hypothetical protein OJF2_04840 [Aquisphaera giovannonii]|uniref:Uncharacterized protein n=1 Tax=Aquisphaera giovannonii TaxID=406548 RepID=A0A5B9VW55_9BACT|nr:hypothetical protein [Aquisphaera giovannonii]QEH32015.1 hypothetical protein OJF2_04840 [Aquisphaera giovannonii]